MNRLLVIALGLLAVGFAVFGLLEYWRGDDWTPDPPDENGWAGA